MFYIREVAVSAYLAPRLRSLHNSFFSRLWRDFFLDSDTRAAADFGPRWLDLIRSIIPDYSLPLAPDPEADLEAAMAAAEAVAIALGEAPGLANSESVGCDAAAGGAGPSSEVFSPDTVSALRSYFNTLWDLRAKWAGVFVRSFLVLTVLTTGRAESWHNVLKRQLGYNGNTTLENLIINNNMALEEQAVDNEGRQTRARGSLMFSGGISNLVVSGAREALSPFAAGLVAREADKAQHYNVQPPAPLDNQRIVYTVLRPDLMEDEGPTGTEACRRDRIVTVTTGADPAVSTRMECSCQMLVSVGLPCRHMLAVLTVRQEARAMHVFLYHPRWARVGPSEVDLMTALYSRPPPPPWFPQLAGDTAASGGAGAADSRRGGRAAAVSQVLYCAIYYVLACYFWVL